MGIDDSSSSSSEKRSFRELDDVFLQSQARIWLGEVLHTRFDELLSICDLLSDGKLLLMKTGEFHSLQLVCKVLGLSGVDLFSPSDVVEKRGTRKVPDFDDVTKTIAMPTNVVGCIRRSLELSTCSVTHRRSTDARLRFRQKSSSASLKQEDKSCLEESDEEKSNFSDTSYADYLYLESGESPEAVDKYALTQSIQQVDTKKQKMDIFAHIPGSAESIVLQFVSSDNLLDGISSPVCESRLMICDEFTPINHGEDFWHDEEPERIDVSHGALSTPNMGEVNHHISLSNSLSFRILAPVHISANCLCHSCIGTETHNSNTTPNASMYRIWRKFPDDIEPSSISSVSSVGGRVIDFDFDAKSEPDDLKTSIFQFGTKLENSIDSISPCADDANLYRSVNQDLESLNHKSQTQRHLGDSLVLVKDNVTNITDNIQEILVSKGVNDKLMKGVEMADSNSTYIVDGFGTVKKEDDQLCTNQSDDVHCYAVDRSKAAGKCERKEDDIDSLAETNTNGRNDNGTVNMEKKPSRVPLMKRVAKGTALIGILFLVHLRNTRDRNRNHKMSEKSSQIHWRSSGVRLSRRNGEKGSKIYPVEKFRFGD
ncbi:Calponin homology domain-containing protein [Cynara cardunculus var. scolymus]|uniref:Calponin homology domain-containing protein n=1 Tax=Cynara cardunculus var. scolymus TaxID=59895 RepID=A0A103RND1_CYNCS|nr:Calponin homology domain-containing protein [Cynara cardunculus var. scolymus]